MIVFTRSLVGGAALLAACLVAGCDRGSVVYATSMGNMPPSVFPQELTDRFDGPHRRPMVLSDGFDCAPELPYDSSKPADIIEAVHARDARIAEDAVDATKCASQDWPDLGWGPARRVFKLDPSATDVEEAICERCRLEVVDSVDSPYLALDCYRRFHASEVFPRLGVRWYRAPGCSATYLVFARPRTVAEAGFYDSEWYPTNLFMSFMSGVNGVIDKFIPVPDWFKNPPPAAFTNALAVASTDGACRVSLAWNDDGPPWRQIKARVRSGTNVLDRVFVLATYAAEVPYSLPVARAEAALHGVFVWGADVDTDKVSTSLFHGTLDFVDDAALEHYLEEVSHSCRNDPDKPQYRKDRMVTADGELVFFEVSFGSHVWTDLCVERLAVKGTPVPAARIKETLRRTDMKEVPK